MALIIKRLVHISLFSSTRLYTVVDAIKTSLTFLQSGVIDRENESELKKLREFMERLKERFKYKNIDKELKMYNTNSGTKLDLFFILPKTTRK